MMKALTLSYGETLHALDHSMRKIPVVIIYKDDVPDIIIKGEEAGRIIHLRNMTDTDIIYICEVAGEPYIDIYNNKAGR